MDQDNTADTSPTPSITGNGLGSRAMFVCEAYTVPDSRIPNEGMAEIQARIQAAYDSGTPIFTKEAIRRVVQAFDRFLEGSSETVPVTGLDGVTIEFKLPRRAEDFLVSEIAGENARYFEYAMREPCLRYHNTHKMTGAAGYGDWGVNPITAYLPFTIGYQTIARHKHTKETVLRWPVVSENQVEVRLTAHRLKWQDSEVRARLEALFAGRAAVPLPEELVINKVVALACSSMAWDRERSRDSENSAEQHALVLGVAELLAERQRRQQQQQQQSGNVDEGNTNDKMVCYAQEPAYHPLDKAVLSAAGVVVLDDPRAFLEVDETSVVVSVAPDIPVREIVADIARPAVLIWDCVTDELTETPMTDPVTRRVRDMINQDYVELECPFDDETFGHMAVYVRKT